MLNKQNRIIPEELSDEEVTEFDQEEIGANQLEAEDIGLPDLPGKSRLDEVAMDIPIHPPSPEAPDSMTEAVMESMRVGVGTSQEESQFDEPDSTTGFNWVAGVAADEFHTPNAVPEPGGENMSEKVRKASQPPRTASGQVTNTGTGVSGTEIPRGDPDEGRPPKKSKPRRSTQSKRTGKTAQRSRNKASAEETAILDEGLIILPPSEGAKRINPGTDDYDTSDARRKRDTVPGRPADATDPSRKGSSATKVTTKRKK